MPTAHVNDIDLYYEIHGEGPTLVLIEGIGYATFMWYRQIPAFAPHFRTLIYDNRGAGRSDKPPGPYNHEQNADDLAGLLDHLGWARTHVLGISMGGFIAQEFALKYPERLNALVLASTAFGGPNMVPIPAEAARFLVPNPRLSIEQHMRGAAHVIYGDPTWPEKHAEEFAQLVRQREENAQPPEAAMAQVMAGLQFNTEDRLPRITAPTLVVTGSEDGVVPAENARLLAGAIPGARLDVIEGAGHHMWYEYADQFNADVIAFLQSFSGAAG